MIHHKAIIWAETIISVLIFMWQPVFGIVSACIASIYYLSVLKINVVDKKYNGSWKEYIKSIFKK
jgi:hypothetical protein